MKRILILAALTFALTTTVLAAIPSSERSALMALYDSTNGGSWSVSTNWNGAAGTECSWVGVRCNEEQTTVTGVSLQENGLSGSLPSEIGNLPNLEELELYVNRIGGSIPSSIGNLSKLKRLLLFDNELSGALPQTIGNLTSLEEMFIDRNSLTGVLPSTIGGLTSVISFSINGNQLEGPLPSEIGQLVNVTYFNLDGNRIDGPLPPTVGMMTELEFLYLAENEISGSLPAEISGATSLIEINLALNQLSGTIPDSIGTMPNLVVLGLYFNQLSGTIPAALGNLPAIEVIDLAQNHLSGPIPPELGNAKTLREIWFQSNQLTGTIPPEIGNLDNLERLQLGGNQLTGSIPVEVGKLSNLLVLSLGLNELSGTIPRELGNLKNLVSFNADSMSLSGEIPAELTNLAELVELVLFENQLTGSIPSNIGNLTKMQYLLLGGNFLTGTIPRGITNMKDMVFLDLRGNTFTGTIPSDIGNLANLVTLQMFGNALTGTIPSSIGDLTRLETLRLEYNRLGGTVPPQIGNLTNLKSLRLEVNRLEGPLPPELFSLTGLESLGLGANRFDGELPSALGNLTMLYDLDVGHNAFRGEVPSSLLNLTMLLDGLSDFRYNALVTTNTSLRDFMNQKQDGSEWENTQTVAPSEVGFGDTLGWDIELTPIAYVEDEGGYRVEVSMDDDFDPPFAVFTTQSKYETQISLFDLGPGAFNFRVYSVTHPHGLQQNTVESDPVELSNTKFFNIFFGELVTIGSRSETLVQTDGQPENETSISILNIGDLPTDVLIEASGGFFDVDIVGFSFDPDESQQIKVTSVPGQPPGEYEGSITVSGNGAPPDGLVVPVKLVSTSSTTGSAIAIPSLPRVDLAGERETNPTGSVSFTNVGDAMLSGLLESDVPWLVPQTGIVTIAPDETKSVSFTIDRSRRPDTESFAQDGAAFNGVLRLVYASGSGSAASVSSRGPNQGSFGVSASLVTVVDSVKPSVSASGIPGLNPGEVGLVIPGIRSAAEGLGSIIADLSIANAYGVSGLSDLRVFFNATGSPANVAAFNSVSTRGSILLADVVKSVYDAGSATGVAHVRTRDFNRILVGSRLVTVRAGKGTYSTSLPVFRTNRGAGQNEAIYLTGLRGRASRTDIVVQSLAPDPAIVRVEYLDASGVVVASVDPVNVGGWDVAELKNVVPGNAVTAIVTNGADSPSPIAAYAINWDDTSGDSWIVVDWSRYFAFLNTNPMKIPVARLTEPTGPRRRPVRRPAAGKALATASTEADGAVSGVDLAIFNPQTTPAIGTLTFIDNNGNAVSAGVTLQARETLSIPNVLSSVFSRRGSATGYLVFTPDRGGFVLSSRLTTSGGPEGSISTTIPVLAQSSGLRLGQSQIFAGLEDTRQVTIDAKQGGTYRTQVGIVETTGEPVTVRATMLFYDGKSLAATLRKRDFPVDGNETRMIGNVARAIIGDARETTLGDLHDFQVEFRVVSGDGAVTVFVETFDNGTGDSVLRTE